MWAKWAGPEGPVGQICFGEGGQENTPSIWVLGLDSGYGLSQPAETEAKPYRR